MLLLLLLNELFLLVKLLLLLLRDVTRLRQKCVMDYDFRRGNGESVYITVYFRRGVGETTGTVLNHGRFETASDADAAFDDACISGFRFGSDGFSGGAIDLISGTRCSRFHDNHGRRNGRESVVGRRVCQRRRSDGIRLGHAVSAAASDSG